MKFKSESFDSVANRIFLVAASGILIFQIGGIPEVSAETLVSNNTFITDLEQYSWNKSYDENIDPLYKLWLEQMRLGSAVSSEGNGESAKTSAELSTLRASTGSGGGAQATAYSSPMLLGTHEDVIWTGGVSYAWNASGNWSTGAIPDGISTSVIFADNDLSLNGKTISDNASRTLGKLTFSGTSSTLTSYTVGAAANTFTFNNDGSEALMILDGNKAVTIANKIVLNDNLKINVVAISTLTLTGGLTGTASQLVKSGAGKIVFSGTGRTFTGELIIDGGSMETTLLAGTGSTLVLGAVDAAKNYLNAGNITVGNIGTILELKSAGGSSRTQAIEINGAVLTAEFGAQIKFTESSATNGLSVKLNAGTLDGGTNANHGTFYLSGADLIYNASGNGGTAVANVPNLVFDTSTNTTAMSVTLNNGTLEGFGLVQKTGTTALNFIDNGTFGADTFQINGGVVNFGSAMLNLTGAGLKFTDATAITSLLNVPAGGANFGRANQMTSGGNNIIVADAATGALKLAGFDQSLGNVTLGNNSKLHVYLQPTAATPISVSFGNINTGTNGVFSIFDWRGNPNTHVVDGTAAITDNITVPAGSYDNVWFRGFDKGAVLGTDGILRPVDFLHTAWQGGTLYWNDIANWTVDAPNHAGAVVTFGALAANAAISLQSSTVTIGHLVTDAVGKLNITGGTLVFDSGVANAASTISGSGYIGISSAGPTVQLKNDLIIQTTATGNNNIALLSGAGNIYIQSGGLYLAGANPNFTGNFTLSSGATLSLGQAEALGPNTNTLTINGGHIVAGTNTTNYKTITNKVVFAGDFSAAYIVFDYAGDVSWAGTRTISGDGYVFFGQSLRLTGSGALVVGGYTNPLTGGTSNGLYEFRNNNNDFSGGLTVLPRPGYGTGSATVNLRGDLVTGKLEQDKNYLGTGSITARANVEIISNGYATTMHGPVTLGNAAKINVTGGGDLVLASTATVAREDNTAAGIVTNGNLAINGATLLGTPNITVNPGADVTSIITSTAPGGITGVGTFTKTLGGTTILDTSLAATGYTISGGVLVLNQSNAIDSASVLTMSTGTLVSAGGTAASPVTNRFGSLNLSGNASIFLNDHSAILFGNTQTINFRTYSLTLQNSTGIWSTAELPLLSDTYVRFLSSTALTAAQLSQIAFTGYTPGAALARQTINGTDYWFLYPTGESLTEWRGAGDTGVDTNRLWSVGSNWVGDVAPNAIGKTVAVRDLDGLLGNNVIIVDAPVTIGKLSLESNAAQAFIIKSATASDTITFNSGSTLSLLKITGDNAIELSAGINLPSGTTLSINHAGKRAFTLSGKITGNGGIVSDNAAVDSAAFPDAGAIRLAGNAGLSDYTGGFWLKGATGTSTGVGYGAREIRIAADGTVFGKGSYNGDAATSTQALHIGSSVDVPSTATAWYRIISEGTHTIDASVRFDGYIYYGGTLTIRSDAPSYITTGIKNLHAVSGSILNLDTLIEGSGGFGFRTSSSLTVNFFRTNTFSGGLTFIPSWSPTIGIGADNALGTGIISLTDIAEGNSPVFKALNGARTLSNQFVINSNNPGRSTLRFNGDITLDHDGRSQLSQAPGINVEAGVLTIAQRHILAGNSSLAKSGTGILRVLSASEYTGNTELAAGVYQSGNNLSFGTTGSIIFTGGTLASYGGSRTLTNKVAFNAATVGLDGTEGLLSLTPSAADGDVSLAASPTFMVTGNVQFGQNLKLTGPGSLAKSGTGTLILDSGSSTYTGGTSVNNGILRINAASGFTSGRLDSGKNYLGIGAINVAAASGNTALLEILVNNGNVVRIGGDVNITGANTTSIGAVNVTSTAGTISGTGIKTYFDATQTIGGNAYGTFATSGDIIKTGSGTTTTISVGKLVTPSLVIDSGTLRLSSANVINTVGKLTIGTGTFATGGLNQTFASSSTLNITGKGIIDVGGAGLLTFGTLGNWSNGGSLTIENWLGTLLVGGGTNQIRFVSDVRSLFTNEMLSSIIFESDTITYAPGAMIVQNSANYYELLPVGTSSEWNHLGSGYNWGTGANWVGNIQPNGVGSSAVFANADPNLHGKSINLDANIVVGSLLFKNTTGASYTLSGNPLTFQQVDADANAVIHITGNNSPTISSQVNLANNLLISHDGTGTLTISGLINGPAKSITKDGTGILVLGNANNNFSGGLKIFDGTVSTAYSSNGTTGALGSGIVTFAGDSALSLTANGAQTIGNIITLNDGVTGTITTSDANNSTISGQITGNGKLRKAGTGILALASSNSHAGGTDIAAGTVSILNNASLGSGPVAFTGSATLNIASANIALTNQITADDGAVATINTNANTLTTAAVSGKGSIAKTGAGTWNLSGNTNLSGTTSAFSVSQGTLVLANTSTITAKNFLLGNGSNAATLNLNGSNSISASSISINNATVDFTSASPGTLLLAGNTTFDDTTFRITIAAGNQNDTIKITSGSLAFTDITSFAINDVIAGEYRVLDHNTAINSGTLPNGLRVTRGNTLLNSTESARTFIGFKLGNDSSLISSLRGSDSDLFLVIKQQNIVNTWTGAVNRTWDNQTTGNWSGEGDTRFLTGDKAVFTETGAGTINGVIAAADIEINGSSDYTFTNTLVTQTAGTTLVGAEGRFVMNGTGTVFLDSANNFENGVSLNSGVVVIRNEDALGINKAKSVQFANGTTLRVGANNLTYANATTLHGKTTLDTSNNTLTLSATLGGTGSLQKTGNGTLILSGASGSNSITASSGAVCIANAQSLVGMLSIDLGAMAYGDGTYGGSLNISGLLAVGHDIDGSAIGTLSVMGNITFHESSSLVIALGAPSNSSLIQLNGGAFTSSNAQLNLLFDDSFVYTEGDIFKIVANGAVAVPEVYFNNVGNGGIIEKDGNQFRLDVYSNHIDLVAVPEPSTYGLLGAGVLAVTSLIRRRMKAKNIKNT